MKYSTHNSSKRLNKVKTSNKNETFMKENLGKEHTWHVSQ